MTDKRGASVSDAYNIADLREKAKRRLPKWMFEFVDRGTEDEVAIRNNLAAFTRIKLKTRVLTDVSHRSLETTIFGKKQKLPIIIAPTGAAGMLWYHGELELARAAAAAGIPFTLATEALTPMEKIAEVGGTRWMQLYMWSDRKLSHQLVDRAWASGFEALLVTVDTAAKSNREYNYRNGFEVPFRYTRKNTVDVLTHPRWMFGLLLRYLVTTGMPRKENLPDELRNMKITAALPVDKTKNDSLNWEDLKDLRSRWKGKLLVKGVLDPADAVKAISYGADGIVVSNHGGRSLDSSPAPIDVLPLVMDAVGGRTTVLVDGGFRRGSDIVKALALGASGILIGRGTLGTAAAGEAGAARAISIYREELDRVMAQIGCNSIAEITEECLHRAIDPEVLRANRVA